MLDAILTLFTQFNPVIVGVLMSTGAYIALRHRVVPRAAARSAARDGGPRRRRGVARA